MKKILVIGSNSFSGSTFINYLLRKNIDVIGVSRSKEANKVLLRHKWEENERYKFYQLDINNELEKIVKIIKKNRCENIINFAAQSMVGESWNSPEDWFRTNTISTINFHNALKNLDFINKYIHISTPEVYGSCEKYIKEDFRYSPSTPYAVSRAAADMSLKTFYDSYKFPVITTRAANVYGPGQQLYRIIPKAILFIMMKRKIELHGGGKSKRSFIHMDDVSDATWKIMNYGKIGETYHISTKQVIRIYDLVQLICNKLNASFEKSVKITNDRIGKDSSYLLDDSKLRTEMDWKDQISLDQGIDECISWVDKNIDILKNLPHHYVHKV